MDRRVGDPYRTWRNSFFPALWLTPRAPRQPKGDAPAREHPRGSALTTETACSLVLRTLLSCQAVLRYGLGNSGFMPLPPARPRWWNAHVTPELIRPGRRRPGHRPVRRPTSYAAALATPPRGAFSTCGSGLGRQALPAVLFEKFRTGRRGSWTASAPPKALNNFCQPARRAVPGTTACRARYEWRSGTVRKRCRHWDLYVTARRLRPVNWCRNDITRECFQGRWLATATPYLRDADARTRIWGAARHAQGRRVWCRRSRWRAGAGAPGR